MTIRSSFLFAAIAVVSCAATARAVTVQDPGWITPDGAPYLWVEAETGTLDSPWIVVDKNDPIISISETGDPPVPVVKGGLPILPLDTNASGGKAIFQDLLPYENAAAAVMDVQFANPGTYFMYIRWSAFNRDTNTNYGNEDSFYLSPTWNKNSRSDWIGYEGINFLTEDPEIGDGDRDGYIDGFPAIAQNYVSKGVVEQHNSTDEDFYDGTFHWYWMSKANAMNAEGGFISFDGMAIQYEVTEEQVGQVLTFEISAREPYGAIDGVLFSQSNELLDFLYTQEELDGLIFPTGTTVGDFNENGVLDNGDIDMLTEEIAGGGLNPDKYDLTGDGSVTFADIENWTHEQFLTYIGDTNLDNEFNTDDLIEVLSKSTYEQPVSANWSSGDWNGSGAFDSSDLIDALADSGYEAGKYPGSEAVASVPEPSALVLLTLGALFSVRGLRRRG